MEEDQKERAENPAHMAGRPSGQGQHEKREREQSTDDEDTGMFHKPSYKTGLGWLGSIAGMQ